MASDLAGIPGVEVTDSDALAAWLRSDDHAFQCAAHSEGQLCCLDKLEPAPGGVVLCDDAPAEDDADGTLVECTGCGTQRRLAPVPGRPGYVSLSEIEDGWTFPPARCPACSVAA